MHGKIIKRTNITLRGDKEANLQLSLTSEKATNGNKSNKPRLREQNRDTVACLSKIINCNYKSKQGREPHNCSKLRLFQKCHKTKTETHESIK